MTDTSLRERSKVRRKRAILLTAMRLFAERGYDATTVSDIAAAADVAPRTVSLYFPSKLEIAQASMNDSIGRLLGILEQEERCGTMAGMVVQWLREEQRHVDAQEWDLRVRMCNANPVLISTGSWQGDVLGSISAGILAEELNVPVDHLAVGLAGGAVGGVLTQYVLLIPRADHTEQSLRLVQGLIQGALDGARSSLMHGA